jgi:hypothetical protein
MYSRVHFSGRRIGLAIVFLSLAGLVACAPSKPAATSDKVFVIFEGPWAFVDDPKDANRVLALAPRSKIHNDLYVAASNDSVLAAGIYDLSVPAHGPAFSGQPDATFAQAKIDTQSLQHALDDKSGRYVIRLPKPEAYVAAKRFVSRVGTKYPPDAATEQNYAVFVALRYTVGSLNGFSLAGTPDSGAFNPLLLQLDTPNIRFAIEPGLPDDLTDQCHTHSRNAFHDTVKFLGLTLYVDFPNDPASCHGSDPQGAGGKSRSAMQSSLLGGTKAFFSENFMHFRLATSAGPAGPNLMAAAYLLHAADGSCKAPILFLTTIP